MRAGSAGRTRVLVAALLALVVGGCSSLDEASPAPSPSVTETPVPAYGDGTLTIATLFSRADPARADALVAGVEAAGRAVRASADSGTTGLPAYRTLHRSLPAAGDGSIGVAVGDLAGRGADVILLEADSVGLPEVVAAAAEVRVGVLLVGGGGAAADDPTSALVRLEDPAVADGALGVPAYRVATLAVLAAVASADDGGLSVIASVPRVNGGAAACADVTPCVDALSRGHAIDYLPLRGVGLTPGA